MKKPDTVALVHWFHGMKLADSCHRIFSCQDAVFSFIRAARLASSIHLLVFPLHLLGSESRFLSARASKVEKKTFSPIAVFDPILQPILQKKMEVSQ